MNKMKKRVRVPKNDSDYHEGEYLAYCAECDCEIAVLPPEKMIKKAREGEESEVFEWLDNGYFYCPRCQKENDLSEMEVSE